MCVCFLCERPGTAVGACFSIPLLLLFPGLNIPVTEVVFENQRYYPWPVKWSAKLLPTDRKSWSDEQGLCEHSRYAHCLAYSWRSCPSVTSSSVA